MLPPLAAAALLALSCGPSDAPGPGDDPGDGGALDPRGPCNPVDDGSCLLPFPSDFLTDADPATGTGRRVALDPAGMPVNIDGVAMTPDFWNELDGWSTLGAAMALLPDASLDGVVRLDDIGRYLDDDVRTVMIAVDSGERAPHWVEREVRDGPADRNLLLLRPALPLQHATTYVVGIRDLVDETGAPVAAPPGFAALRDGTVQADDDDDLRRQVEHYDAVVFPTLDAAGFHRDDLQLAWSFTTTSVDGSLGRALAMRDAALDLAKTTWAQEPSAAYTIDHHDVGPCTPDQVIAGDITGHFTAPLYLEEDAPGSVLTRDANGMPVQNGVTQVPFTLRVPCSVYHGRQPAPLLQFGHGLLGTQAEVYSGNLADIADQQGLLLGAVDWTGMKEADRGAITMMIIEDPGRFAIIPERLLQGFVEQQLFTRLVNGPLALDDALQVDGQSLVDPSTSYFYGISQGAILGGGLAAQSMDFERVALGVPGMPFTLLLPRSEGFLPFLVMLETLYEDPAEVSIIINLMQHLWDPAEAAGSARFLTAGGLDDQTPAKPVLLLAGIGDAYVPAIGAHTMARAYGATSILPANRSLWGIEEAAAPFVGSAFIEWDFGIDDPLEPVPADGEAGVHWAVTGREDAKRLVGHWLATGEAIAPCDGACDPD